jgi:transcriptional regulator with XRE-family HTH domain
MDPLGGAAMPRPKTPAPIGQRIKTVRTKKKVTLEQLANDTGYSIEYLKQIESGSEIPPVGTLLQISRALHIDSGDLLKDQQTRDQRADAYIKRTQNYAYTTLTPGAEHKHLKAFRILVKSMQSHKGVGYQHEGEEFVYVLKGRIEVTVGEHVNHLEEGQSLHFNSGVQHHMRNVHDGDAELLVVVYNP